MQPTDLLYLIMIKKTNNIKFYHISTAFVYYVEPSKISGALYHLVATYSVNTGISPSFTSNAKLLASPKLRIKN